MRTCNICGQEVKTGQSYQKIGYGTGIVHIFCIIPKAIKAVWAKKAPRQGG